MSYENGRRLIATLLDEHVKDVGETAAYLEARTLLAAPDAARVRADIANGLQRFINAKYAYLNDAVSMRSVINVLNDIVVAIRSGDENRIVG